MLRRKRDIAKVAAVLVTVAAACAPAAAAQSGGTPAAPAPVAPPAPAPLPAPPSSGGALYGEPGKSSLVPPPVALAGRVVHLRGTLPGAARRGVVVQRLDSRRRWRKVASARVRSTGRYLVRWRASGPGRQQLRAVVVRRGGRVRATRTTPRAQITVYRAARATYFGPGLYGRRTACGLELTPALVGVAHRRLPCGTPVAIDFGGRATVVPVVDRGPFVRGVSWDLTEAAATILGFVSTGSGTIGVLPLAD